MREIKFRAWNKILKQFVPIWSAIETRGDNVLRPINYGFIIEQYTGLKDKNGVDIYENDVVTIPLNEATYLNNTIAVISYNENSTLLAGRLVISRIYTAVEVVGNIHENADLLEGE